MVIGANILIYSGNTNRGHSNYRGMYNSNNNINANNTQSHTNGYMGRGGGRGRSSFARPANINNSSSNNAGGAWARGGVGGGGYRGGLAHYNTAAARPVMHRSASDLTTPLVATPGDGLIRRQPLQFLPDNASHQMLQTTVVFDATNAENFPQLVNNSYNLFAQQIDTVL
jgi:hypothetical protein